MSATVSSKSKMGKVIRILPSFLYGVVFQIYFPLYKKNDVIAQRFLKRFLHVRQINSIPQYRVTVSHLKMTNENRKRRSEVNRIWTWCFLWCQEVFAALHPAVHDKIQLDLGASSTVKTANRSDCDVCRAMHQRISLSLSVSHIPQKPRLWSPSRTSEACHYWEWSFDIFLCTCSFQFDYIWAVYSLLLENAFNSLHRLL